MAIRGGDYFDRGQFMKKNLSEMKDYISEYKALLEDYKNAEGQWGKTRQKIDAKTLKTIFVGGTLGGVKALKQLNEALKEMEQEIIGLESQYSELSKKTGITDKEELKRLVEKGKAINEVKKRLSSLSESELAQSAQNKQQILKDNEEIIAALNAKEKKKGHLSRKDAANKKEAEDQLTKNKLNEEEAESINKINTLLAEKERLTSKARNMANGESEAGSNFLKDVGENSSESSKMVDGMSNSLEKLAESQKKCTDAQEKSADVNERTQRNSETLKEKWGQVTTVGSGLFDMVKKLVMFGAEWEDKAFVTGRAIGFTTTQTRAYLSQMTQNLRTVGVTYGLTSDQIAGFQDRVSKATGKAIVMSKTQTNIFAAASKVFGEQVTDETVQKMDSIGGGMQQAGEALMGAQLNARRYGFDASQLVGKFTDNLVWAQKHVNFKDGVNGVMRMTVLSESLKINMQSIMAAADKMSTVEGSIKSSASLQMLGGNFAREFSDPMRVLYESQSDPEAIMKRVLRSTAGSSTFNLKTGLAQTNYYGRAQMKAAAQALGIDESELLQSSQAQAKLQALGGQMNGLSDDEKLAVANRAQRDQNGNYTVDYYDEKTGKQVHKGIGEMTTSDVQKMSAYANASKDINGNVNGIKENLFGFSKDVHDQLTGIENQFKGALLDKEVNLLPTVTQILQKVTDFINAMPTWLTAITAAIAIGGGATAWAVTKSATSLAGKIASHLFPSMSGGFIGRVTGNQTRVLENVGENAASETFSEASPTRNARPTNVRNGWDNSFEGTFDKNGRLVTEEANVTEKAVGSSQKGLFKNIGSETMGKIGGSLISALIGAYMIGSANQEGDEARNSFNYGNGMTNAFDKRYHRGDERGTANTIAKLSDIERNRASGIGAGVGTAIGGILGTIFGGGVGGFLGGIGGMAIGKSVGGLFAKSSSKITYEEQSKDRAKRYLYETGKFGIGALNGQNVVGQATIKSADILSSIYMLLAQKFGGKGFGKDLNVEIARANGGEKVAKEVQDSQATKWYKPWTWFSNGGVIKAANGYSPYEGDHIHIRANAGEMVLNQKEQGVVSSLINSPYSKRTKIESGRSDVYSNRGSENAGGNININFSGSIKLDAGGQRIDFTELLKNEAFKREMVDMIIQKMNTNHGAKTNKNLLAYKQSSHDARGRMYNIG